LAEGPSAPAVPEVACFQGDIALAAHHSKSLAAMADNAFRRMKGGSPGVLGLGDLAKRKDAGVRFAWAPPPADVAYLQDFPQNFGPRGPYPENTPEKKELDNSRLV
jgi:hypothetical protein